MATAAEIKNAFINEFGQEPKSIVYACGRINLIGEHTDYNEGYVLPAAVNKYIFFAIAENQTAQCNFYAHDIQQKGIVSLQNITKSGLLWLDYLQGILQQFQLQGKFIRGVNVVFGGNLPIGSGISSSAALECGFAWALNQLFEAGFSKLEIAQLAHHSSNQFIGVPTGIMDQFASVMGKKDHFILLDCKYVSHQYIPANLGNYKIILLNSKVHHELGSSEYPVRVAECKAGVTYLQQFDKNIKSLRDVTLSFLDAHREGLNEKIYRRCKYVVTENQRLLTACEYLQRGKMIQLGALLFETHTGLRDDYEVSCKEIDFLVDFARGFDGVVGARIMGGGFGGCTINLVEHNKVDLFIENVKAAYTQAFGIELEPLFVEISEGTDLLI